MLSKDFKKRQLGKSGFTLVELIVVIVVLGILAAIGIPRYNNYVNSARLTHIKADMKSMSRLIEMDDINDVVYKGDKVKDLAEIETAIVEGRAYKEGNILVDNTGLGGEFHLIEETFVKNKAKSKLKGTFLVDKNDEIYYIADKKLKGSGDSPENNPLPDGYVLAKDEDFEWVLDNRGYYAVNESKKGYYHYIGSNKSIEIPHEINGNPTTSYYKMFHKSPVERVVSTNSKVIDMENMFGSSSSQSLDLSSFDTSHVTNMSWMFYGSSALNLDLSSFDTSNVTDMSYMFRLALAETLDTSSFNTSNVTNMKMMFYYTLPISLELSSFNTSSVTDMKSMFRCSSALDLDLSSFNTSSVIDMSYMFDSTSALILDLSSFDTSNVTDMNSMFEKSKATELNLISFSISEGTNMRNMFNHASALILDLSSFDISKGINMDTMFYQSKAIKGYARTQADVDKLNNLPNHPIKFEVK